MELGKYYTTVNMFNFLTLLNSFLSNLYTKPKFLVLMASRSFCLSICFEE